MSEGLEIDFLRRIRVSGPDARAFLQSQLTRDMADITPDTWRTVAWCDPRGRVLSVMMARGDEDHVDLVLPAEGLADITRKLSMYTIGRRVELAPAVAVGGGHGEPPGHAASLEIDPARWLGEATDNQENDPGWLPIDLRTGLPWLLPAASGRHLPQFLGLQRLGALDYRKGCFPGQEVIARLHHLGRIKHGLRGFRMNSGAVPAPASALHTGDGLSAGEVVIAAGTDEDVIGLAVVPVDLTADTAVNINGTDIRLTPPDACANLGKAP